MNSRIFGMGRIVAGFWVLVVECGWVVGFLWWVAGMGG